MPPEIRRGAGPTLLVFQPRGRRRRNWPTLSVRSCLKMKTVFRKQSLPAAKGTVGGLAEAQGGDGGKQRSVWWSYRSHPSTPAEGTAGQRELHLRGEKRANMGESGALAPLGLFVCRSANTTSKTKEKSRFWLHFLEVIEQMRYPVLVYNREGGTRTRCYCILVTSCCAISSTAVSL